MKHSYMCNFGLQSPFPNVSLSNAPAGAGSLVRGSQLGALIGGGMGLEKTLTDAQDENMPLPKAVAKGVLNVAGGATLGTLTGLGGGVLLNRVRGINNAPGLDYASSKVFGELPPPVTDSALGQQALAAIGQTNRKLNQLRRRLGYTVAATAVGNGLRQVAVNKQLQGFEGQLGNITSKLENGYPDVQDVLGNTYNHSVLKDVVNNVQNANMHLNRKMNMAQFAIPTRITSLGNTQAPLSYARKLGLGLGVVKGATEGSDNITIDSETGVGSTGVGLGERLYKVGTNALGGYLAGDVGGRLYNNRAALLNTIKQHKDNTLARLPTVNIEYN